MKLIHFIFRGALCLMLSFSAIAQADSAAQLADRLNTVKNMQAAFTQVIYDNRGKAIQTSYGEMAFQRPNQFRWQVKKPIPQTIIANASKLWVYDPDLEQVTIRALHQAAGEAPALLLSHDGDSLNKDFVVKTLPDEKGLSWFLLKPKQEDNMFAGVKMGFRNGQIIEMKLEDHLGHTTFISFKNIKTNTAISAAKFNFVPPANVDVIDETKRHR